MPKNEFYNEEGRINSPSIAREVASIEDKGHPQSKVEKIIRRLPWNKSKDKAKLEGAQAEADEYEKMRLEQFELGEKFFAEMEKAVSSNKVFNILDGKPVDGVGPLTIGKLNKHGVNFSIFVQIVSKHAMQGEYPLYQIDLNFGNSGKEIHVFDCPYGPDNNYALSEADAIIEKLSKEISEFRLYKESEKE